MSEPVSRAARRGRLHAAIVKAAIAHDRAHSEQNSETAMALHAAVKAYDAHTETAARPWERINKMLGRKR